MRIFVARHGETQWNRENKVCGRTDLPLTENGLVQAELLAQTALKYDLNIIVSSPMLRARQTAAVVAEKCNIPVLVDDRLIEQNYGIYEGVDRKDPAFLENKRQFAYKYPGGESMMQMAYRIYSLLEDISKQFTDKKYFWSVMAVFAG